MEYRARWKGNFLESLYNQNKRTEKRASTYKCGGEAYGKLPHHDMDDYTPVEQEEYADIAEKLEDIYNDTEDQAELSGRPTLEDFPKIMPFLINKIEKEFPKKIPAPVYLWLEDANYHFMNSILCRMDKYEPSMRGEVSNEDIENWDIGDKEKKGGEDLVNDGEVSRGQGEPDGVGKADEHPCDIMNASNQKEMTVDKAQEMFDKKRTDDKEFAK